MHPPQFYCYSSIFGNSIKDMHIAILFRKFCYISKEKYPA